MHFYLTNLAAYRYVMVKYFYLVKHSFVLLNFFMPRTSSIDLDPRKNILTMNNSERTSLVSTLVPYSRIQYLLQRGLFIFKIILYNYLELEVFLGYVWIKVFCQILRQSIHDIFLHHHLSTTCCHVAISSSTIYQLAKIIRSSCKGVRADLVRYTVVYSNLNAWTPNNIYIIIIETISGKVCRC